MRVIKVFLVAGLSLLCFLAEATQQRRNDVVTEFSTDSVQNLREAATLSARSLLRNGFAKIGDFDLASFVREVETVRYKAASVPIITRGRLGHRYDVESRTVFLSVPVLSSSESFKSQIVIAHETLGALGYSDDNYQITAALMAAQSAAESKERRPRNLNELLTMIKLPIDRRFQNPTADYRAVDPYLKPNVKYYERLARGGGVSEGGGGGDPDGAVFKSYLLLWMLINRSQQLKADMRLLNFTINRVGIEFQSDPWVTCPFDRESAKQRISTSYRDDFVIVNLPDGCRTMSMGGGQIVESIVDYISSLPGRTSYE